ncbi:MULTISPECIES: site-2 protease family protein [Anaeromyxobacter]|uniref:site-2 protease family protein n=1 Tax=Anaeromyxobacter TaxID=161492 RepID=UPI001F5AE1D3|nr:MULTISPECIES: site-2 protease family protein [unclassified Anaeromyxobacter]
MDNALILERVLNLIVLLLSLTFHEFFHAWSAWRLGDDTAARLGRLTLNPVPHIDPIGTLLLPLLGAPIGWAKPVPVNPARFRKSVRQSTGDIIVSAAGPLSNLLLGTLAAITLGLVFRFSPETVRPGGGALELLQRLMIVNAGLAIFNLLPVPPLDGSHVAENLMPYRFRPAWEQFARFSPFILLGLIVFGRGLIYPPVVFVFGLLQQLTLSIAT